MPHDIDIEPRLLRAFVAVAEELHFTRAAARLYVAQQALSRDVRRVERLLGAELFARTTRSVTLTADGARLLPYARRILAAYEELAAACAGESGRPLLVDTGGTMTTGHRVLVRARETVPPDVELVTRFHSGLTGAAREILSGRLDVSFGWAAGLPADVRAGLEWAPVRLERMAVLLPDDHPLAARETVPLAALRGETLYAAAGNEATAEWTRLAELLFAGRGIGTAEPFPGLEGEEEFVRVVRKRGWSVLASEEFIAVPGMALRPLVDPVPLSPVAMVWRKGLRHAGLDALRRAAAELAGERGWRVRPAADSWLPPGEAVD
ncbi:LysR family transcriptional regulator [Streptomyces sp. NPDC001262]|uniref:LysR family transcriptional regulator n=1 Tax=Streptomyces sp. NPDC001262 TaxID=3364552 RepID=UPI0036C90E73